MKKAIRITADEALQRIEMEGAVLVCAYDDDQRCAEMGIDNALSLRELEQMESALDESRTIIFYCA
jgi:hypothetical protein